METSNIVSVLVFLAFIIIPLWWLVKSGSKRKKGMFAKFNALGNDHQLNFSETDSWDNIIIGIDKNARKVLYFRELETGDERLLMDLGTIALCKKINQSRKAGTGKDSTQVVDQLGLELVPKENFIPPILLEFYNSKNSFLYSTHLELQTKWCALISECIRA